MLKFTLTLFFVALPIYGQSWSGIIAPSRATNWSNAGLPATLPDGETTPNPWTPPTRTQCTTSACQTVLSGTVTTASINAALASAVPGQYALIPPGTFPITSQITMYLYSGVTLRGSGPKSTTLAFSGSGYIELGYASNGGSCAWSSGFSAGTTTVNVSGCTSSSLNSGQIIQLTQCDTGASGPGCTTGTISDNGGLFVCGEESACEAGSETGGQYYPHQVQNSYITSVSGGSGSYTITFTPGLMAPNWSAANSPTISWLSGNDPTHNIYGDGIEEMTVTGTSAGADNLISLNQSYASWVKGIRFVGAGLYQVLTVNNTSNVLISNNYFYRETPPPGVAYGAAIRHSGSSGSLILNNIGDIDILWEGFGHNSGNVIAYNYARDAFTPYVLQFFEHVGGSNMVLFEGNQVSQFQEDDTHGTHALNTWFRNYAPGYDAPYSLGNLGSINWDNFARFENAVGNVFGDLGGTAIYESTGSGGWIFRLGGSPFNDSLVKTTSMRWGNWDSVTNAVRWCGNSSSPGWSTTCASTSEVPSSLASPNVSLSNPVPSTTALPASFFMPTTAHLSGGTGLNWWTVCTNWTTFPTTCGGTQTQPFPSTGPEVMGGRYGGGHAYDIPARLAWANLPIDISYQSSYTVTASSWSGGIETLTISGLPNIQHLMGAFQLSGMNPACTSGATFNSNNEILITASTSTTVSYALTSNPSVSCIGTFKFPDVRQFDQQVYQMDPTGGVVPTIMNTSPLPNGDVAVGYSYQFMSSGTLPVAWSAAGVPAWATLTSAGLLSGTPTSVTNYTLNVTATNSAGSAGPIPFTLSIKRKHALYMGGVSVAGVNIR